MRTGPISGSITSPASSPRRFRCWRPSAQNQPHRDRHGGHRHALREPALYGRGRGCGRSDRRRSASARHQPGLARAGDRRLAILRLSTGRGPTDADIGRRHAEVFLDLLRGEGFARPNPRPMFPNPPGPLRLEPYSEGLRDRIWWGAGSNATAIWAAKLGMNLQSSTLKNDETGEAFHVQQAAQIRAYRAAWKEAGHTREPRVSVSRSIFALMDDRDRGYFGNGREDDDQIEFIDERTRAIFGRSYAAEPTCPHRATRKDEADHRGRHAAADRPQPVGRRLQRACDRSDSDPRRARPGVALTKRHILLERSLS